jgi:chromosomal replication initiator protein
MSRTATDIVDRVAEAFGIPREIMLSDGRTAPVCRARWAAMRLIRDERHLSTPIIARILGRADHTTVLNGLMRADRLLASDDLFAARYREAQGR